MPSWKKIITSGSNAELQSLNISNYLTLTGSINASGSNTLLGDTYLTGSLNISGSTFQLGNNTLIGSNTLSGSIIISGTLGTYDPSVRIYGDLLQSGYHQFLPVTTNINTSISSSYIYVSGSTQDLYFSQNGSGYNNVTRLRWIEGNLYTGLLHGGLITSQSSTVYQISSGSGIIVNLNASLANDPYPTIQYLNWPNLSASIANYSASYDQQFVAINSSAQITAQGTPYTDGDFNTKIPIGIILHQNHSTINGVKTSPSVAYGWKQRTSDFVRSFGPLKIAGYAVSPSGSATGSLIVGNGTAFVDGANYAVDPNNPSYASDSGTTTSKIFRYYQSGSDWVYNTNNGAGYASLDPVYYNPGGLGILSTVGTSNYSLQRCYWYPNSVTKAVVVYYGNDRYGTLALAQEALSSEQFSEAPNTTANAVYLGSFAIKGGTNTTLQNTSHFTWIPGGLFRSISGAGGGNGSSTQTIAGLTDVNITSPLEGQVLSYNSASLKWINSTLNLTSASFATTSSFASFATTASFALNINTASFVSTSSFNSLTASVAINAATLNTVTASLINATNTPRFNKWMYSGRGGPFINRGIVVNNRGNILVLANASSGALPWNLFEYNITSQSLTQVSASIVSDQTNYIGHMTINSAKDRLAVPTSGSAIGWNSGSVAIRIASGSYAALQYITASLGSSIRGVSFNNNDTELYVADRTNSRINVYSATASYALTRQISLDLTASLVDGISYDSNYGLFVCYFGSASTAATSVIQWRDPQPPHAVWATSGTANNFLNGGNFINCLVIPSSSTAPARLAVSQWVASTTGHQIAFFNISEGTGSAASFRSNQADIMLQYADARAFGLAYASGSNTLYASNNLYQLASITL